MKRRCKYTEQALGWHSPCDVIHDAVVSESYVFADSQGSRLFFFPVVENVLTHVHIQLAARSKY